MLNGKLTVRSRIGILWISLTVLCIFFQIQAYADSSSVSVTLTNTPVTNGITVRASADAAQKITAAGKECWKTNKAANCLYFVCNVDDNLLYNERQVPVEITVEYYDQEMGTDPNLGSFCIQYDSEGTNKYYPTEAVKLTGTNTWKTYTFTINNCEFKNACSSGDFRIAIYSSTISGTASATDVSFGSIALKVKEPVTTSLASAKVGNIFTSNDNVTFDLGITNVLGNIDRTFNINYNVKNFKGIVSNNGSISSLNVSRNTTNTNNIVLSSIANDTYTLEADILSTDGEINVHKSLPFSRVAAQSGDVSDSIFGACTHFCQKKGDVDKNLNLVQQAGIKWIRDEYAWSVVETTKGIYTFPAYLDAYVNAAAARGIKPLIILDYGNALYAKGSPPSDDEGRKAFAAYAKAVAEHLKGKADAFELWNEWNGGMGNPSKLDGTYYASLLKEVYTAIKSVNPNATVVAGATIQYSESFMKQLLVAGGYSYMDAVSYHPYCYPADTDLASTHGSVEYNIDQINNLMKKYGGPKPIWLTEVGWFNGNYAGNISEEWQASFLTRLYVLGLANSAQRIFWYDFQDDGVDPNEKEYNFGMVKCWQNTDVPWAAKQNYVAMSALTGKLKGAAFVKEYRPNEMVRVFKFYRASDNKEIIVMYNISGTVSISFNGTTGQMQGYDMYGNPCTITTLSESPVYLEGTNGQFDPKGLILQKWLSVKADLTGAPDFNGIRGENDNVMGTQLSRECWKTNISANKMAFEFDVDDTYIYDGNNQVEVTVEYYDGGTGKFCIEYDATGSRYDNPTGAVILTNTGTWKTAAFTINDARFANNCNGKDLRLTLQNSQMGTSTSDVSFGSIKIRKLSDTIPTGGSALLSDVSQFNYLQVWPNDNATKITKATKAGRTGWLTDKANSAFYLVCDVNDNIIYNNATSKVQLTVDYFDGGNGKFYIEYDSASDNYKDTSTVNLRNTNTWKTATFTIKDAQFANGTNNGDFRINVIGSSADVCFGGVGAALVPVGYLPDPNYEIVSSSFTDEFDTVNVTDLTDISYVKANVQFKNNIADSKNVKMFIVLYNGNGKVVKVGMSAAAATKGVPVSLNPGIDLSGLNITSDYSLKVFVWDAITFEPLVQPIRF